MDETHKKRRKREKQREKPIQSAYEKGLVTSTTITTTTTPDLGTYYQLPLLISRDYSGGVSCLSPHLPS